MKSRPIKYYAKLLIFLLSIFGFFVISYLSNLAYDDFNYKFIYNESTISHTRVTSVADVLVSQYHHYFVHSGRVLIHSIVQFFLMFDSKIWFDIFNAIVFGLFQISLSLLAFRKRILDVSMSQFLLLLVLLWFILPGHNYCMFWLSGSVNYLWSTTAGLFLIYIHSKIAVRDEVKNSELFLLFFGGFFLNATHEVLSIAISVALFIYLVANYRRLNKGLVALSLGSFLSTFITAISPANFRLAVATTSGEHPQLKEIIASNSSHLSILLVAISAFIFLSVILAVLYARRRVFFASLLKNNYLILIIILVSLSFAYSVNAFNQRAIFSAVAFAIVILLRISIYYQSVLYRNSVKVILACLIMLSAFEYSQIIPELYANRQAYQLLENQIQTSDSSVTIFPSPVLKKNRFMCFTGLGNKNRFWISNEGMSRLFKKKYLVFLPKNVVNHLNLYDKVDGNRLIYFPAEKLCFVSITKGLEQKILSHEFLLTCLSNNQYDKPIHFVVPSVCSTGTKSYLYFTPNRHFFSNQMDKYKLIVGSSTILLNNFIPRNNVK